MKHCGDQLIVSRRVEDLFLIDIVDFGRSDPKVLRKFAMSAVSNVFLEGTKLWNF